MSSSTITPLEREDVLPVARTEVLRWARRRAGAELPADAWHGSAFEMLAAGRTTMGASFETESGSLWSLRQDDPDGSVPGRIWSTEISLGRSNATRNILLGVRLLVNSNENVIDIEPAVPGLVLQSADNCAVHDGSVPVWTTPHYAETEEHADTLIAWLLSETR